MLKKYAIYFLFLFFTCCEQKELLEFIPPEIFVSTAYFKANKILEVNCETVNSSAVLKEEYGICWAEHPNPTRADNYQYSGNNSTQEGPFVQELSGLDPNKKLYITGYMRVAGKDVYSEDFIYEPTTTKGWIRLDDMPRDKNTINLPVAYLVQNINPTFRKKVAGTEQAIEYTFNDSGRFWLTQRITTSMIYDQFFGDIEYGPGRFDSFSGGGYYIENSINNKKVYLKTSKTNTYSPIADYPGANAPAVGFGAGNKGFVLEITPNPKMYAFNEENFTWEKMADPPLVNFTNIKATRAAKNGFIILENALGRETTQKAFSYIFETDRWVQLNDFPGKERTGGVLFAVKNKVYYGLGTEKLSDYGLKDFWEFDLFTQKWTQIGNYPGAGSLSVAFVKKGDIIYLGMGYSALPTNIGTTKIFTAYDFWEFNP